MKNSSKFRNLSLLIFSGIGLFVFLFVYAFARHDLGPRSGYELPKRVVKLNNNTDTFHVLKIAHSLPVSHPLHISISKKISFEIKKDLSRSIIPEIYPANQLGDSERLFLAVQKGTIEMVVINAASLWTYPEFDFFSHPFRISGYDELENVMSDPERLKEIAVFFQAKNIKFLGWSYGSSSQVVTTLVQSAKSRDSILLKTPNDSLEKYYQDMGLTVFARNSSILDMKKETQSHSLVELSSEELFNLGSNFHIDGIFQRNFLTPPLLLSYQP